MSVRHTILLMMNGGSVIPNPQWNSPDTPRIPTVSKHALSYSGIIIHTIVYIIAHTLPAGRPTQSSNIIIVQLYGNIIIFIIMY